MRLASAILFAPFLGAATNAASFQSDVASGGLRNASRKLQSDKIPLNNSGIRTCTEEEPCGRCEGDCHRDEDCEGNLVCYNVAGKHESGDFCARIPGCSGEDLSKTDWCIRPEDMPNPNLCDTREEVNSHTKVPVTDPPEIATEPPVIEETSCDELKNLFFDLTTKINDVDAETLRYEILTQELEQTAITADPHTTEEERSLSFPRRNGDRALNSDPITLTEEDQASLKSKLAAQQERLSGGNSRFSELNTAIRAFVTVWRDENGILVGKVSDLTAENGALLAERDDLSLQIDDLTSSNDRLQGLIDQHADLNDELDGSVTDLQAEIERLRAENLVYQGLNANLSSQIDDLESHVSSLEEQNNIFAGLNEELRAAQGRLDDQIDALAAENEELSMHVTELNATIDRLENATERLTEVNDDLEENVRNLEDQVDTLEGTVDRLEQANGQLETIVSFVNETSIGIDESLDQVTAFLANQVSGYRSVALETLQNIYNQRVLNWDCSYRDSFGDYQFAFDGRLEIPEQNVEDGVFDMVIDYVDERVLTELCLNVDDFEKYLEQTFSDPVYTSNHLIQGINTYTSLAFNYYFPDDDDLEAAAPGTVLTTEDWAAAGYDCENLPSNQRFKSQP